MKKQKIKVNGVSYKYIITEDNTLKFDRDDISYDLYETIKERLIKKGKYQESHEVHYTDSYLQRRFKNWSKVELKLYLEELEEKNKNKTITPDEILCIQPIREEIERREK